MLARLVAKSSESHCVPMTGKKEQFISTLQWWHGNTLICTYKKCLRIISWFFSSFTFDSQLSGKKRTWIIKEKKHLTSFGFLEGQFEKSIYTWSQNMSLFLFLTRQLHESEQKKSELERFWPYHLGFFLGFLILNGTFQACSQNKTRMRHNICTVG